MPLPLRHVHVCAGHEVCERVQAVRRLRAQYLLLPVVLYSAALCVAARLRRTMRRTALMVGASACMRSRASGLGASANRSFGDNKRWRREKGGFAAHATLGAGEQA